MNILSPILTHGWAVAGTVAGVIAGSAANLWKSGSLLAKDMPSCTQPFNGNPLFTAINDFREIDLKGRAIPLFLPANSPVIQVPMLGCAIYNTITQRTEPGFKAFCKKGWQQLSKIYYPPIHAALTAIGAMGLRVLFNSKFSISGLDVSGHACLQTAYTLQIVNSLNAIHEVGTPWQQKAFKCLALLIAITDVLWMYNTTASCHAIADVVVGAAFALVSHVGMIGVENAFCKGCQAAKQVGSSVLGQISKIGPYLKGLPAPAAIAPPVEEVSPV